MFENSAKYLPNNRRLAFKFFLVFVFMLFAFPRARLIPSLPFYVIDAFILGSYLYVTTQKGFTIKTAGLLFLLLVSASLSELQGLFVYGYPLESIYMLVRFVAGITIAFSISKLLIDHRLLVIIIKVATLGALISAITIVLASLPFTRSIVNGIIFSNPFLAPPDDTLEGLEGAVRGRSLIGTSNLTAAFINTILPYAFFARVYAKRIIKGSVRVFNMFLIVGPLGVFLGYSRGGLLGLLLVLMGFLFLGSAKIRKTLIPLIILLSVFLAYAWGNQEYFMFDRIERRTAAVFQEGELAKSEKERLQSFTEPFVFMLNRPTFIILGEGNAAFRLKRRGTGIQRIYDEREAATHSAFAKGFYTYGISYSIVIFVLVFGLIIRNLGMAKKERNPMAKAALSASVVSLLALLPWMLTTHGMVTNPRGFYLYIFIYGLAYIVGFTPFLLKRYSYIQFKYHQFLKKRSALQQ